MISLILLIPRNITKARQFSGDRKGRKEKQQQQQQNPQQNNSNKKPNALREEKICNEKQVMERDGIRKKRW